MNIMDIIQRPMFMLALYSVLTSFVIILMTVNKRKSRHKYKRWKKEKINLLVYVREYEVTPDEFFEQLWNENQRLEKENKALKKEFSDFKWSVFMAILGAIFSMIWHSVVSKFHFKKSESSKEEKDKLPPSL